MPSVLLVDDSTWVAVLMEMLGVDLVAYFRRIMVQIKHEAPALYAAIHSLACADMSNALSIIARQALTFRLYDVQCLRRPERLH